jgi:hypothetical protein
LNNRVFSKYNFDFDKISEDKIFENHGFVVINEIVVNEENKHVYGISNNYNQLFHFDKEFKLIQTMDITIPVLIKVFNNNLYMLLQVYDRNDTSQLIENEKSFIDVYSQYEYIEFNKKIVLDVLVLPNDFHVDENYIFIFSRYTNKDHLINHQIHVLVFNHDGIFLQKTGLYINSDQNTRYLVVDYQTIYCDDHEKKKFIELKFN